MTNSGCDSTSGGWGDLFDVPGMIVNAVTSFLGMLIEQIMQPVRALLANTLLAAPDVTQQADIKRLWTATLGITGGIYVLFVTAGGVTVMGYETVQTRYAVKQIVPRLLIGMVAAAGSLTVMGKAIKLSNALAHAIMATDMSDAGQGMVERVLPFALFGTPGLKLYLLLLAIVMIMLVLAVLIGFLVRVAVMALMAVAGPLMLACHAHPLTDPVARLWWRALAGCLVIQVAQSMTFVLALKLFFAPGATVLGIPKPDQLGTMLAGIALFWVLFKIPGWTLQVVLRGTPVHNPHAPAGVRVLKHLAMYRLMSRYLPGMNVLQHRPRGGGGGGTGFGRGRGGPGGSRPGGGGSRPPAAGPGHGGGTRGGSHALLARGRAALTRRGTRPGASSPPPPGAPATTRARRTSPVARQSTGPDPVPRRPESAARVRAPRGPRAAVRPARARRAQQLPLPAFARHTESVRQTRPASSGPPIRAARTPASPLPVRTVPTTPPAPGRPATTSRARQLALPIPAERVRVRPPRPMQLRLPLEQPRR